MKRSLSLILLAAFLLTAPGCARQEPTPTAETAAVSQATVQTVPPTTLPETIPTEPTTLPTEPETLPPETETTAPTEPPLGLTEEEQALLLQLAMAERNEGLGYDDCPICMALAMRTVLNRVESGRFSKSIRGVIYAPEQFTPVLDGSFDSAVPNEACYEALDLVLNHWDESQGALYYEWCEGESWHSQNLHLLFQHCNTRFYN